MILQDMCRKSLITNSDPARKNIYSSEYSYGISPFNEKKKPKKPIIWFLPEVNMKPKSLVHSLDKNSIILLIQAWFAYKNVLLNKLSWDKKYQF